MDTQYRRRYRIADDAIPNAHAQIWAESTVRHNDPSRVAVYREEDGPDGAVAYLPKEWLVEVRPPSIDGPVVWPWRVRFLDGGLVALRPHVDDERLTMLEVGGHDSPVAASRALGADSLRDLARAAWQRANAIEAAS